MDGTDLWVNRITGMAGVFCRMILIGSPRIAPYKLKIYFRKAIMAHPLAPSYQFLENQTAQAIVQGLVVSSYSPLKMLQFGVSYFAGHAINYTSIRPFLLPTQVVRVLSQGNERVIKKISWVAPALGMAATTLIARVAYDCFSSMGVKGLVTGMHAGAMSIFSMSSGGELIGVLTMKNSIRRLVLPSNVMDSLRMRERLEVSHKSEAFASSVALVASLSLTLLGQNVIITNAIAYTLAPIVKVAAMYLLANQAQEESRRQMR